MVFGCDSFELKESAESESSEARAAFIRGARRVLQDLRRSQGLTAMPNNVGTTEFMWLWVKTKRYHFGVGAPPILVYFSGDWDVHWGYGLLTHGHVNVSGGGGFLQLRAEGSFCHLL